MVLKHLIQGASYVVYVATAFGLGFAAVNLGWGVDPAVAQSPGKKILVCINLPLAGPMAVTFLPYANGISMGIDDAVTQYGVPRSTFEIDAEDNENNATQAVSVAQQQSLRNCDVYVSGSSKVAKAVAPIVEQRVIPHFIVAYDSFIVRDGKSRLRVFPHFKLEAPLTVDYVLSRHAKRVAILYLRNEAAFEKFSVLVEPQLAKAGIEVMSEGYEMDTTDYNTLALKVAQFKPDLTIVGGFSFQIYPIIKSLRTLGLVQDGSVVTDPDLVDLLYNKTPREELVGMAFITPIFDLPDGAPAGAPTWAENFQKRFGTPPSFVGAYGYDVGRILVTTWKHSGNVNVESIRRELPFNGISGAINLDKDGDIDSTMGFGKILETGRIETVKVPRAAD